MDSASSKSAAKGAPCTRVSVLLPLNLPGPYDYRVPPGLELAAGDVVLVPLGARQLNGVVWGPGSHEVAAARLRDVIARRDVPPLPAELRRFVDWVAAYTLSRPGPVLRMAISVPAALAPPKPRTAYQLGGLAPQRLTPARARVLELLAAPPVSVPQQLLHLTGLIVNIRMDYGDRDITRQVSKVTLLEPGPGYITLAQRDGVDATARVLDSRQALDAVRARTGVDDLDADLAGRHQTMRGWLEEGPMDADAFRKRVVSYYGR